MSFMSVKKTCILLLMLAILVFSAAQVNTIPKKSAQSKRLVPVHIQVSTASTVAVATNDLTAYVAQFADELNINIPVKLYLVENEKDAEVVLELEIVELILGPREEKIVNKAALKTNVVGKDAQGTKISQTVNSVYEQKTVKRETKAIFKSLLLIKNSPEHRFEKTFTSTYLLNYTETSGEPVVSHGVQRRRVFIEPKDPEYLMLLTKAELTGKISGEIRKYYQNQTKTAQLNSGY